MNPRNPEQPTTRAEYEAEAFQDRGEGIGEDDFFDDLNDFEEEEDEE
jgi:hypothetical protein